MDFNLETFVENYTTALKDNNAEELVKLISSLDGNDQRKKEALAGVIKAIEADEDLIASAADSLKVLKTIEAAGLVAASEEVAAEVAEES